MSVEAGWFGVDDLGGSLATQDMLAGYIQEAYNQEKLFELANDEFLQKSMDEQKARFTEIDKKLNELEVALESEDTNVALTTIGAVVSTALGGALIVATTATSPIWVGVAAGALVITGTVSLAVSLARSVDDFSKSGLTFVGFVNNRIGLLTTTSVGAVGKIVGRTCFFLGALIDASSIAIAHGDWAKAKELRNKAALEHAEIQRLMSGPLSDKESWRSYKIEEAKQIQTGLENIRSLYTPDTPDYKSSPEIPINPQF